MGAAHKERGTNRLLTHVIRPSPNRHGGHIVMPNATHPVLERIAQSQKEVLAGHCSRESCARCSARGPFARHELRRRKLRVIVDTVVQVLSIVIARYRCGNCRYVFTDYPDFRTPLQAIRQHEHPAPGQNVSRRRPAILPVVCFT